jgi:acetyl esterase
MRCKMKNSIRFWQTPLLKMTCLQIICLLVQMIFFGQCLSAQSIWDMDPLDVRDKINEVIMETDGEKCEVFAVQDRVIKQGGRETPIRVYSPNESAHLPIILFIHGGGWVAGNLDTHDNIARYLCHNAQAIVVSVGYLNSPEGKFPYPLEQCYDALLWTVEQAKTMHADSSRIAIVGDSAGGNMTAGFCILVRDRKGPSITLQVLINPSPDLTGKGTIAPQGDSRDTLRWFAAQYVATADDVNNPYVSPSIAKDLSNLPPALIILAERDDDLQDGQKYADRLRAAHVETQVYIQQDIGHLAGAGARASKSAQPSLEVAVQALRKAFDLQISSQ